MEQEPEPPDDAWCSQPLTIHKCYHCNLETNSQLNLAKHTQSCNPKTPLTLLGCDKCEFSTYSQFVLMKHHYSECLRTKTANELSCNFCLFKTYEQPSLKRHLATKHKLFRCPQCSYKTDKKHNLKVHKSRNHRSEDEVLWYLCEHCAYKTKQRNDLRKHMYRKHATEEMKAELELQKLLSYDYTWKSDIVWFSCEQCVYKTHSKDNLRKHVSRTHESSRFKCPYCSFQSRDKSYLGKHVLRKHSSQVAEPGFACAQCEYKSTTVEELRNHCWGMHGLPLPGQPEPEPLLEQTDTNEPVWFNCSDCVYKTTCRDNLRKHFSRTHKTKSFACPHCSFQCKDKSYMSKHVLHKHLPQAEVPWVICESCHYMGDSVEHCMRSHQAPKRDRSEKHSCKLCPFKTNRASALKRHLTAEHQLQEELLCEHCAFQTNTGIKLKRHMVKEHFGEDQNTRYYCDQCLYKTYYLPQLKQHKLYRHTSEENIRWFQCEDCSFRAKAKSDLREHVIVKHTPLEEIRWHHCQFCDYKAKVKWYVTSHVKKAHEGRLRRLTWMNCEFKPCKYRTRNPNCLRTHLETKHPFYFNSLQEEEEGEEEEEEDELYVSVGVQDTMDVTMDSNASIKPDTTELINQQNFTNELSL